MNTQEIEFLGNKIGIEKVLKSAERDKESLFVSSPEISDQYGVIKYLGPDLKNTKLEVGDKIYYGNQIELVRLAGKDIYVMAPENVIAIIKQKKS